MKLARLLLGLPLLVLRKLNQAAWENKHEHRLYGYYAFPALMGLAITFVLVRSLTTLFPAAVVTVNSVHVHHFTAGIFILIVAGYIGLWVKSSRWRYITALAYGVGVGFILDEFYVWLRLDSSTFAHSQYDIVVVAISIFLMIILLPVGWHGFYWLLKRDHKH